MVLNETPYIMAIPPPTNNKSKASQIEKGYSDFMSKVNEIKETIAKITIFSSTEKINGKHPVSPTKMNSEE